MRLQVATIYVITSLLLLNLQGWQRDLPGKQGGKTNSPDIETVLDSIVNKAATKFMEDSSHVGLSIGIYAKGASYSYHYGTILKGKTIAPDANTIYELASLTKTFTGILLAQAVVDKKLKLSDPVSQYLGREYANLTFKGRPVRIVDLANHTSGLPKNIPELPKNLPAAKIATLQASYSQEAFLHHLKSINLQSPPGFLFTYSNAGTQLIGIILEKVYHQSYEQLVQRYICGPNQMSNTSTLTLTIHGPANIAQGYNKQGKPVPYLDHWKAIPAAANLKSNTQDLLKFMEFNLKETDHPAIQLAHQYTFRHTPEGGADIGLFWFSKMQNQTVRQIMHGGGSFGMTTFCLAVPQQNKGIVCLANDAAPDTEKELKRLADHIMSCL